MLGIDAGSAGAALAVAPRAGVGVAEVSHNETSSAETSSADDDIAADISTGTGTGETEQAPPSSESDSESHAASDGGAPSDPAADAADTKATGGAAELLEQAEPAAAPVAEAPGPAELHDDAVTAAAASTSAVEAEIVQRTNDLRRAQGRPALKTDPRMHSVAQQWSTQQAKANKMLHNPQMGSQIPAGWTLAGENVAYGQKSAKDVVTAWWNSPGHKANMLHESFTHIGVGVAYSASGRAYYTQVFARYPKGLSAPGVFTDVNPGAPFYKEIAWMMESGLSTGYATPAGKAYKPKESVSREAMAAFLYRLKTPKGASKPAGYTIPRTSPFSDVSTKHKFYKEIAWMYASGISTGTAQSAGKPKYDPKSAVSREAMAAFLSRMEQDLDYRAPGNSRFADVGTKHKFYRQISWMYDVGLSTGVKQPSGKPKYQPRGSVTREAMAAFIYRLEH